MNPESLILIYVSGAVLTAILLGVVERESDFDPVYCLVVVLWPLAVLAATMAGIMWVAYFIIKSLWQCGKCLASSDDKQ